MTVARNPGERIEGEKITYCFGRVTEAVHGGRTEVTLSLNGEALVAKRWRRVPAGATPSQPAAQAFDSLVARSARGECDKHRQDRGKQQYGSHRAFTGVLVGSAHLSVTTPA